MCEYCDKPLQDALISLCGISYAKDTMVYIEMRKGEPKLVMEQDCGAVSVSTEEPIRFCPKCGHDLRGDA